MSYEPEPERCLACGRADADERWLWLTASRMDPHEDCEYAETELVFCSQEHAGRFLLDNELTWPTYGEAERAHGVRVDGFFLGCGLIAIVLSVIGIIAIVRFFV